LRAILFIFLLLTAGSSEAATLTVSPGQSIQAAIDAASPEDTVQVLNGTYNESVNVTKRLTLRGVGFPLVVAKEYGSSAIRLSANGAVLEGFRAEAEGYGSSVIFVTSSFNTLKGNRVSGDFDYGIELEGSCNSTIAQNTVIFKGDHFLSSSGICLSESSGNDVLDNVVDGNDYGIRLTHSNGGNVLKGNLIRNCSYEGISMSNSGRNKIVGNYLLDNEMSAWDDRRSNQWDDGSRGNYYSDLDCSDAQGDGVCDSTYAVEGGINVDRYPLASWDIPESYSVVTLPEPTIARSEPLSQTISPSNQPQTISYQDEVKVTIPGGLLQEPQALTIARMEDPTSESSPFLSAGEKYEISLGDAISFNKEISIGIALDVSRLDNSLSPQDQIIMTSWNETRGAWERVPFEVENSTITANTKHLSIWTFWYVANGYKPWILSKQSRLGSCRARLWYLPEDYEKTRSIAEYLNTSWNTYDSAGFRMPTGTLDVFLDYNYKVPEWNQNDIDNVIYFISRSTSSGVYAAADRCDIAHELFHAIQNCYMYSDSMSCREWWMDATASYAESRVAWPNDNDAWNYVKMRAKPDYLQSRIDFNQDPHRYATGVFIDFLVREQGANFKKMWEYTSSPSWLDTRDALDPLDKYLKETFGITDGLAHNYRDFAEYYLFDLDSPMQSDDDTDADYWRPAQIPESALDQGTELSRSNPNAIWDVTLKDAYTAKLWMIKIPENADPTTVNISLESGIEKEAYTGITVPWEVYESVTVYRLEDCLRTSPNDAVAARLNTKDKKSAEVEITPRDGLYVLAINTGLTEVNLEIKASIPTLEIQRPFSESEKGTPKIEYPFSVIKSGIPDDAEYEWDFGDGDTAQGESSVHTFESEGEYTVKVKASWKDGSAENETEIYLEKEVTDAEPEKTIENENTKGTESETSCQTWGIWNTIEGYKGVVGSSYMFCLEGGSYPGDSVIEWSFGDGTTEILDFSVDPSTCVYHAWNSPGVYNIEISGTWSGGCSRGSTQVEIVVPAKKEGENDTPDQEDSTTDQDVSPDADQPEEQQVFDGTDVTNEEDSP
jgi:parallel beta-helix repeat protein